MPYLKRREAREAAPGAITRDRSESRTHRLLDDREQTKSANMPAGVGVWAFPSRFWGRAGRKKERTTRTKPQAAYRGSHPHTRRYNPDVQDVEYIRDAVQK